MAKPSFAQNSYLLINGGASIHSNYAVHEADLHVFNKLFGGNGTILNANGENSMVVPLDEANGVFKRDPYGWVQLRKTSLPGKQTATKPEVLSTFKNLSEFAPDELTIVYGDHGTRDGISLWNGENLSARELQGVYSLFPDSTTIRAIHLHCYGGSSVVDQNRSLPPTAEGIKDFLRKYYPPNRCALTLSGENELGQYYGWNDLPKKNPWAKLFENAKRPSLSTIKFKIANDRNYAPSPILTSDYMLKDIADTVCQDSATSMISNTSTNMCVPTSGFESLLSLSHNLRRDLCAKCQSKLLEKLDLDHQKVERLYFELMAMRQEAQAEFLRSKFPQRYQYLVNANQRIEKELADSIAKKDESRSKEQLAKLSQIQKEYADRFLVDMISVDYRPDFEDYFERLDEKWVHDNSSKYPQLAEMYLSLPKKETFKKADWKLSRFLGDSWSKLKTGKVDAVPPTRVVRRSAAGLMEDIHTALRVSSEKRKIEELRRQEACRNVAEPLLKNSNDVEIRKLYESIGQCENTSIN